MPDDTDPQQAFAAINSRHVLAARLLTGLAQGIALYLLFTVSPVKFPDGVLIPTFSALLFVVLFIPSIAILGFGALRARPLARWTASLTPVVAALGYYAGARRPPDASFSQFDWLGSFALAVGLFCASVIATDSIVERRAFPPYDRYFDRATKYAIQIGMAGAFVLILESVLQLGASLFNLIGISQVQSLIYASWFWPPAITTAAAFAIHATDAAPATIRSVRSLALTLFSWLLPIFALIVAGFLVRITFASLAPLWDLEYPTGVLLSAALLLVILINCHYQNGSGARSAHVARRVACSVAIIELVPLVGLAAWALGVRVLQYGWTVNRIYVLAVTLISACFALGYIAGPVRSRGRLSGIETTNIATAYVFVVILLALSSPVADPARLMVSDQVSRLTSGAVDAAKFDYSNLRWQGERWGNAALAELATTYAGPDAALVHAKAQAEIATAAHRLPQPRDAAQHFILYPPGTALPSGFIAQIVTVNDPALPCFRPEGGDCIARATPALPAGGQMLTVFDGTAGIIAVFSKRAGGRWQLDGSTRYGVLTSNPCNGFVQTALKLNTLRFAPHALPDVVIGELRLTLDPGKHSSWDYGIDERSKCGAP